jgi:hypothetical protein
MAAATTATSQAHAGSRVTPLPTPIKTPSPELIRKSLLKQKLRKAISNAGKAAKKTKKTGRNTRQADQKGSLQDQPGAHQVHQVQPLSPAVTKYRCNRLSRPACPGWTRLL